MTLQLAEPIQIRRSAWRGWGWALIGIPFLVMGVDVLFTRFFTDQLLEIVYSTAATKGAMESRDYIFAAIFMIVGGGLVLYGLKELVAPAWVILADDLGLEIRSGPFGAPLRYRWEAVGPIRSTTMDIDGHEHDVVRIHGLERRGDVELWGARWVRPNGLDVLTDGWGESADVVAERLEERRLAMTDHDGVVVVSLEGDPISAEEE